MLDEEQSHKITNKSLFLFIYFYFSYFDCLLGVVHTRSESLQDGLGDMQTCGMTLALAYVLHCLSTVWSQFQRIRRSLR